MSLNAEFEKLQEKLNTRRFGKLILFSPEVSSTNSWAKELARAGAEEGTVALAETQTCARGRHAREWVSPVGGLWFSIVLRPNLKAREAVKLLFVASLAVAEVLRERYKLRIEAKWPNDVLVNGKKICGVMAEMKTKHEMVESVILGVGVNANFVGDVLPKRLRTTATSIESELGRKVRLMDLLKALLEEMEDVYYEFLESGFSRVLDRWKKFASFLGHKIVVTEQYESLDGVALDVDGDGALILSMEDGSTKRILTGDLVYSTG